LKEVQELEVRGKPSTLAGDDEARSEAVGSLLASGYAQASTLKLTEAESKALQAPFGDEAVRGGAKGDDRILYISHIHVSDRLNSVLGIGQWCIVKRNQRAEQVKTVDGKPLTRIYYEGVMLIRGAFVTEAIGVGQYHPNNPKEDYGTGLESAMSDCITRCCKRLGIGSQVWDKGYCDKWLLTKGGRKPIATPQARTAPTQTPGNEPAPPQTPAKDNGQSAVPNVEDMLQEVVAQERRMVKGPVSRARKEANILDDKDRDSADAGRLADYLAILKATA